MAKRKASNSGEAHFSITQANLDNKGKTNKKLKRQEKGLIKKTLKRAEDIEKKQLLKVNRR